MKILRGAALILISSFLCFNLSGQKWVEMMNNPESNFFEVQKEFNKYWEGKTVEKGKGWKQFKRWEYFMERRVDKDGKFAGQAALGKYYEHSFQSYGYKSSNKSLTAADWKPIGPNQIPINGGGAGRLNCIAFHPTDPNTVFAGAASGGIWKSSDAGLTWSTNTDHFATLGISDIVYNPVNPNIMYAATGDGDGGDTYSIGVLKSNDAGNTWQATGLSWTTNLNRKVNRLIINQSNPSVLFAATSSGLYRSTDAGLTWASIRIGFYRDIAYKPGDTSVLYLASSNSFFKSSDGGVTFNELTNIPFSSFISRLVIGVTPADPAYIYILAGNNIDQGFEGLYKSSDEGNTFTKMSSSPNILGWSTDGSDSGGQAWYDLSLAVSHSDKNIVYVGGVNIWKSTNGGSNWELVSHWYGGGGNPYVHADIHKLSFHLLTGELFACTDGGLFVKQNSQKNIWENRSNGLSIGQIYRLGVSATDPDLIMTGWQDNGSNFYNKPEWSKVIGGDGMECAIDYSNNSIMYGSMYYGKFKRSTDGGVSWNSIIDENLMGQGDWVTPFAIHPTNPQVIFAGFSNLWKSEDRGDTWTQISSLPGTYNLKFLAIAPSDANVIYTGSGRNILRTTDGGTTWETISPGIYGISISDLAINYENPDIAWFTIPGYKNGHKVYMTRDGGMSWTNISGSLLNLPINCIVLEKESPERLYIGTDVGVYVRDTLLNDWVPFSDNLPNVIVNELEINYQANKIFAATYGRGLWESTLPQIEGIDDKGLGADKNRLKVYPNPASESLTIQLSEDNSETIITFFNELGQIVKSFTTQCCVVNTDVRTLPYGVYLIRAQSESGMLTTKFFKR